MTLLLNRYGDYPLYDVEIRISDQDKVDKFIERHFNQTTGTSKIGFSIKQFYEGQIILKIGNIGINQGWAYGALRLPNQIT